MKLESPVPKIAELYIKALPTKAIKTPVQAVNVHGDGFVLGRNCLYIASSWISRFEHNDVLHLVDQPLDLADRIPKALFRMGYITADEAALHLSHADKADDVRRAEQRVKSVLRDLSDLKVELTNEQLEKLGVC